MAQFGRGYYFARIHLDKYDRYTIRIVQYPGKVVEDSIIVGKALQGEE